MRRFFALTLSVLVFFSMAGCSRDADQTDRPGKDGIPESSVSSTLPAGTSGAVSSEDTDAPDISRFTYNPYYLPEYAVTFLGDFYEDYLSAAKAIQAGDSSVVLKAVSTAGEFENFRRALQVFYVPKALLYDSKYMEGTGPYSFDVKTKTLSIKYALPKEEYLTRNKEFAELIESIFNENVTDISDQVLTAAELFHYVVSHTSYSSDMSLTVYDGFTRHIGYCQTYAEMYQQLLWQAGMECYTVSGETDMTDSNGNSWHEWNMVKLGDSFYHMDTTWDTGDLFYFGMSDGKCKDTGHGSLYTAPADALLDHYKGPVLSCTSEQYNNYWQNNLL